MKTSFDKASKLFRRSVFLCACYAVFLSLINIFNLYFCISSKMEFLKDIFEWIPINLTFSLLMFVFFMIISYEFYSMPERCDLSEIIKISDGGELKLRICQSIILFLLLFGVIFNLWIWGTASYFKSEVSYFPYYIHLLKILFLYFLMPGVIGCMLGYLIASRFSRRGAYIMIVLFAFLGSPLSASVSGFSGAFLPENIVIYINRITDLFVLAPYDQSYIINYSYGFPMETYRWQGAFFFFFLLLGIILLTYRRQSTKVYGKVFGVASVCIALVFAGFSVFDRGSFIVNSTERPEAVSEFVFDSYENQKMKSADFEVSSYKMELKITNKLKADVKMTLKSEKPLDKYEFTLHSCYKIKSVEDGNGNPLKFERDSHYFTVYPNNTSEIPEIRIVYSGYNPITYTNNQGIYLPGSFSYYPMEGCHLITIPSNARFNNDMQLSERNFDVTVETPHKKLYSNLEQSERNHFVGKSDGLTLTAGFIEEAEITINGEKVRICGSAYTFKNICENNKLALEEFQQLLDEYNALLGINIIYPLKDKSVICNGDSSTRNTVLKDHMIGFSILAEETATAIVAHTIPQTEQKMFMRNMFLDGLSRGMEYFERYADDTEVFDVEKHEAAVMIWSAIQQSGEQEVYRAMYNYLTDETDARTPEEFLKSL